MADSVTLATSAAQPARSASRSMTSSWISVESTSITISRIARRYRPARCTATSTPLSPATWASEVRREPGSAPETSSSTQVTGIAGQPGDPVDVGAARRDPAGDGGDRVRQQRAAEQRDVQPAVDPARARP